MEIKKIIIITIIFGLSFMSLETLYAQGKEEVKESIKNAMIEELMKTTEKKKIGKKEVNEEKKTNEEEGKKSIEQTKEKTNINKEVDVQRMLDDLNNINAINRANLPAGQPGSVGVYSAGFSVNPTGVGTDIQRTLRTIEEINRINQINEMNRKNEQR